MSVVPREARLRWAAVGACVAVLCALPAIVAAWPAGAARADPSRLLGLILDSAGRPYQGYANIRGEVGLPDLPAAGDMAALLGGETSLRAWYSSPRAWRVAELTRTGETDTYRTSDGTYVWDFEENLLTQTVGELPVRLPRAADLLPPDLARRLLSRATSADRTTSIGSMRVAGVAAAGLRLTPADPETTVGRVDVWADPETGLPLRVELAGRDGRTVITSRFLELTQRAPDPALLAPRHPPGASHLIATGEDVANALNNVAPLPLPPTLDGRARWATPADTPEVTGLGAYGAGLAMFAVVALPGRVGGQSLRAIRDAGGAPVTVTDGEAYEIGTSLVNALIVRTSGDRARRRTYLLVGSVAPELLRRAGVELLRTPVADS